MIIPTSQSREVLGNCSAEEEKKSGLPHISLWGDVHENVDDFEYFMCSGTQGFL